MCLNVDSSIQYFVLLPACDVVDVGSWREGGRNITSDHPHTSIGGGSGRGEAGPDEEGEGGGAGSRGDRERDSYMGDSRDLYGDRDRDDFAADRPVSYQSLMWHLTLLSLCMGWSYVLHYSLAFCSSILKGCGQTYLSMRAKDKDSVFNSLNLELGLTSINLQH